MRVIKISHLVLTVLVTAMITGFAAFSIGVMVGDAERMNIAVARVNAEIKAGIKTGKTFREICMNYFPDKAVSR